MKEFIHDKKLYYNPIDFAMNYIGGTWKVPIILALRNGPVRYGDLKKAIPRISHKMLITQLRELEDKQMLTRHSFLEKPPRVEYKLTQRAEQALSSIDQLAKYGELMMKEEGI
ncbi:MAG: transcriptional regulator [Chitinophagaceae bacterium]|nr:MAG: transcriptional regulator [Chitinophagaceae bacterium]